MEKSIIKGNPSLSSCQVLTSHEMEGIECGKCKENCKKSCITNMNAK